MSHGHRTLKDRMLNRLLGARGWLQGADMAEGLSTSQPAIEDALADLVLEELAEFKLATGYRLKATALCREAMRTLKRTKKQRAICGHPFGNVYRVGVAEHREGLGLVMWELEVPNPPDGPDFLTLQMRQINQILNHVQRETAHA